jgi:hypothetical protein
VLSSIAASFIMSPMATMLLLYSSPVSIEKNVLFSDASAMGRGRFSTRAMVSAAVDEYQDTNRLQSSILFALKPGGRGLTVVGDDAQSIYAFRAATVRNILDFPDQFSPKAEVVTLDRNYRSTQPVLSAANAVIGLAKERFTKNLWTDRTKPQLVAVRDEADQARYIVERVLENREEGSLLKHQAVLFRTSSYSGPLEIELTRRNIPFVKFGGLKFLDAAQVKDMLALLRFVENPRDRVAGFRILHLLPGVGPASAQRVLDRMAESADPIGAFCALPSPPRAGDDWKKCSFKPSAICVTPSGRRTSNAHGSGTNRTWIASTKTPRPAAPISSNSSRSRAAIRHASVSSPSSRLIRPTSPATSPASRFSTRTTSSCRPSIRRKVRSGSRSSC